LEALLLQFLCRLKLDRGEILGSSSGGNLEELYAHDPVVFIKVEDDAGADFFGFDDTVLVEPEIKGVTFFIN